MKKISGLFSKKTTLSATFLAAFILLAHAGFSRNILSEKIRTGADSTINVEINSRVQSIKTAINVQDMDGTHGIVRIYGTTGKKISETILMPGMNRIDVSKLEQDTYFLCITMDGGSTYRQKFIKE
ncbi:MAG TPA: T9SS type A sorting domain-containing protein [Puia sp.]|nr:T9SS type A sorting domain-containing protein [Puia sp.]